MRLGMGFLLNRQVFLLVVSGMFLANLALIFLFVPTERVMGVVQRIFYFHVPLALVGFLSFFIVFIASVSYLASRRDKWDRLAHAAAEVGVVFLTAAIISGAIWAKPVWGTWWTWDARLTTTFLLWVIYVGYLMVRNLALTRDQAARYCAVIGIIGVVDIPIIYMASEWWRTLHPSLVAGPLAETGSLEASMRSVFYFSIVTFTLLLLYLIQARSAQKYMETTIETLRLDHG